VSGRECQPWASDTPHEVLPGDIDNGFPDSREEAENYCRNPDSDWEEGVWCYTMDNNMRRESCDVPECGEFVLTYITAACTFHMYSLSIGQWLESNPDQVLGQRLFLFLFFCCFFLPRLHGSGLVLNAS